MIHWTSDLEAYIKDKNAWGLRGCNLDALLAPSPSAQGLEDDIGRHVVLELLATRVQRLRLSREGRTALLRMIDLASTARMAESLWGAEPSIQFALADFFTAAKPLIARVPEYLLSRFAGNWRAVRDSPKLSWVAQTFERRLRALPLGHINQSRVVTNLVWMLANPEHNVYLAPVQTRRAMAGRIATGKLPSNQVSPPASIRPRSVRV